MRLIQFTLLATGTLAFATAQWCSEANLEDLAAGTACGCPKQLNTCLRSINENSLAIIKACYVANECDDFTASRHAEWIAKECPQSMEEEPPADLRKRQNNNKDEQDNQDSPPTTQNPKPKVPAATLVPIEDKKKTTEDTKETTEGKKETTEGKKETTVKDQKTTASPAKTDAKTTEGQTTPSASTPSTTPATISTPASTTANPTTTPSAQSQITSGTKLECFVTNMVSMDLCSWTAGKSFNCVPTVTPSPSCAPGIICQKDTSNNDICLRRDDHLTTSGLAVTIFFGVALLGALVGIVVMQAQAAKVNKRAKMERMAMLAGGKHYGRSSIERPQLQTGGSDAHLPLIDGAGGMASGGTGGAVGQYFDNRAYEVSPHDAPKLHPGLGALGQDGYRGR